MARRFGRLLGYLSTLGFAILVAVFLLWMVQPTAQRLPPSRTTSAVEVHRSEDPHRFEQGVLPLSASAVKEVERISSGDATYDDQDEPCPGKRELTGSAQYGTYVVRTYRWPNSSGCFEVLRGGRQVFTAGGLLHQIGGLDCEVRHQSLTPMGTDVTGDGKPDLVIGEWSGGAHCCFDYTVYELGARFRQVTRIEAQDDGCARFVDLDRDGRYEFVALDWTFAYWHASFGFSPAPQIILRFRNGKFRLAFDLMRKPPMSKAEWNRKLASVRSDENWAREQDLPDDLELPQVLLDLIYSGQAAQAERFLNAAWPQGRKGKGEYRRAFLKELRTSPYWDDLIALNGGRAW